MQIKLPRPSTKSLEPPLRLLAGYIPEASRKDAMEFAEGVAIKHCTAPDNSYYGVIPWRGGFAYEVQEGGSGRSLLASVLAEFDKEPSDPEQRPVTVAYVQTHLRMAKISRTSTGLGAVAMPEGQQDYPQSDFVTPGKALTPMVSRRAGVLVSGVLFLALTSTAFMFASWGRIQPYASPPPKQVLKPSVDRLPIGQLADAMASKLPVKRIEFREGKWAVVRAESAPSAADPVTLAPPPPKTAVHPAPGGVK